MDSSVRRGSPFETAIEIDPLSPLTDNVPVLSGKADTA